MDKLLYQLLDTHVQPFDEVVVSHENPISVADLSFILEKVFLFLSDKFSSEKLFLNEDWHNHDGYITKSKSVSWVDIKRVVKSIELLKQSIFDDDDYVYVTFYSESLKFLLRYDIFEADDEACQDNCATFELYGTQTFIDEIMLKIEDKLENNFFIENASEFMNRSYSG